MNTKALFGILTITLALSAQVQAQFNITDNYDGTCTITGYTGSGGAVVIPTTILGLTVTGIGDEAFQTNSSLTSVTIPGSVTNIGDQAFGSCTGLTSVTIGNGVASIGEYAFFNCIGLTSVTIGNGVTSIGEYAFFNCTNLTSVTIPASVTSIGEYAFYDCTSLTSVYFEGNAPIIGTDLFNYDPATAYYLLGATGWSNPFAGLPSVAIPAGATVRTATTLSITLTATYQLPDKTSGAHGNITTGVTNAVSFTSKSILKLLATSLGSPFPSGACLAQEGGSVEATNKAGYGTNLSAYITINNTSSAAVVSGSTDSATGKQNGSGMVYTVIKFNDGNGNAFTVDGLIKETISMTAWNAKGDQTETGSFSGDVAGYGTLVDSKGNKVTAVFSGTISGCGKGPAGS